MQRFYFNIDEYSKISEITKLLKKYEVKCLILGETHGFLKQEKKWIENFVSHLTPSKVLYERLENQRPSEQDLAMLLSKANKESFSRVTLHEEISPILSIAYKYNVPIEGCDLQDLGRTKPIPDSIEDLTPEEVSFEENLLLRREHEQFTRVDASLKNTEGFVLVIVGAYHLRKGSSLYGLKDSFAVLVPARNGEILLASEDQNNKEIMYMLTIYASCE